MTISFTQQLLSLSLIHILVLMAPGPDFLMMLRSAISQRLTVSLALAGGIASAIVIHASLVVFAGSQIMQWLPLLQQVLPPLCAGYLFYLSFSGIYQLARQPKAAVTDVEIVSVDLARDNKGVDKGVNEGVDKAVVGGVDEDVNISSVKSASIWTQGFLPGLWCNLLNPKAYIYFLSVLAAVTPAVTPLDVAAVALPLWFQCALVALFSLLALLWFSLLALCLRQRRIQGLFQRHSTKLEMLTLMVLALFALVLLIR